MKIDPKEFVSFRLSRPGFSYTGASWQNIRAAFDNWTPPCILRGIREDGSEAILKQK